MEKYPMLILYDRNIILPKGTDIQMKQKLRYTLLTATIIASTFTACGENSTSTIAPHMTQKSTSPVQHIGKYGRAVEENDFDVAAIEWEYDNHEGLKIHLDSTSLYLQFTHDSQAENIQFFLDIDDNALTGNSTEGGADYMVENGYLYEATSANDWGWKEIGKVKSVVEAGKVDTVALSLKELKNKNVLFKANAQALNADWTPIQLSPQDGTKSIYSQKNSIDWSQVPDYATNANKRVKLFDTKENIYIQIIQEKFSAHTQVYIDSDNRAASGFSSDSWNNFGRDYLIEDGYLYRYTGQGAWGWEFVDTIEKVKDANKNATLTLTLPKKRLTHLANAIKIGVETNNENWTETDFIPDGVISTYKLKPANPNPAQSGIEISEVMASNAHTILDPDYYNFSDWIELHNTGDQSVDIGGYQLSDKLNKPKWIIPEGTTIPANGYLLIWADEKDKKKKALHTNFKLKSKGEAVALFDKEGKTLHAFEYKKQLADISIMQKEGKILYLKPTPKAPNKHGKERAILSDKPTFSQTSGFVSHAQIRLSAPNGATIYYTTDGSIPTVNSTKYTKELSISKTTSIRAISIEDGKFPSPIVTETYIVGEDNINLPVIAITTDDKFLFDDMIGIYTIGENGKAIKDCDPQMDGFKANYVQKWERPAHMVMFEEDKHVVLSQEMGLKIAGECSRQYPQKSFQLKANSKYGEKSFAYQVFPDKNIKKFERLKLRNGGQDFIKTHMRDALAQMISKNQMQLNYEAYRPAVLFLNGHYWGVYSIREKIGKEYLEENYDVKKVNLLEDDTLVKEGTSEDYDALNEYLRSHSLLSDDNYNYVASQIDIDNYIDYMITNIYVGNADWPGTNLIYWKEAKIGTKWQWLLHDMDFGFGLYSENNVNFNAIELATDINDVDWPNPEWSTLLFRKLLENGGFKKRFKDRFNAQLDTTFTPARVNDFITTLSSKIAPQMQRHIDRWSQNGEYSYAIKDLSDWQNEVNKLKTFANQRPAIIKEHLKAIQ
jgi:hypothetical protein